MGRAISLESRPSRKVLGTQKPRIKRDLKDMRFLYITSVVVFVVAAMLLAYVWSRLAYVELGYEISRLNEHRAVVFEKNRRLRVELGKLKSPERIEGIAAGEFGLVYPTGERIVRVK